MDFDKKPTKLFQSSYSNSRPSFLFIQIYVYVFGLEHVQCKYDYNLFFRLNRLKRGIFLNS